MHLAYSEQITSDSIILSQEESLHVTKVLRLKQGDAIKATDGKGSLAVGIIANSSKKNLKIECTQLEKLALPYQLELAICPPKSNDRLELILEKCTELGIKKIHPIVSYHSERRKLKPERLEKILISAMKQSQKSWLPELSEPIKISSFLAEERQGDKFILHCNAEFPRTSLKSELKTKNSLLLIGPEGDFSDLEIEEAQSQGFKSVHIGSERLRTETAAIFATSIYHTIFSL